MSYENPLLGTSATRFGEFSIRLYFSFIHETSITMQAPYCDFQFLSQNMKMIKLSVKT